MVYDGRQIANFVLDFCDHRNIEISNLSLQKIIYFCHVWSLVKMNRPLVKQKFEAWKFGPVLQYVYHEFKHFERKPIKSRALGIDSLTGEESVVQYSFDEDVSSLLDSVVGFYSRLSPSLLVDLSHAADGPWSKVYNHLEVIKPGMKMDNSHIREYYSKANTDYEVLSCT